MNLHAYIFYNAPNWAHDEPFLSAWPCDVGNDEGRFFIGEMDFNVDGLTIPTQAEITATMIDKIKKQIEKIKADSFVEIQKLEEKIQNLLCIENKVANHVN